MPINDAGNDYYGTTVKGMFVPVNIYYLNKDLINRTPNALAPVNQSGVVLSMIYTPFLSVNDLQIMKIPYDSSYYGSPGGGALPYVYKVMDMVTQSQQIKELAWENIYGTIPRKIQAWTPDNESKLFQYPYTYLDITDYVNPPLTLKSTYIHSETGTITVKVRQTLSLQGGYTIFVEYQQAGAKFGYKGDKNGTLEGIMSQGSLELPTSSSQYSQWLANNKSQFMTANQIANRNYEFSNYRNKLNATTSLIGGGLSQLGSLNILGALGTGIETGVNYDTTKKQNKLDRQNFIDNQMAFISDKKNAPRNVNLCGGDILNTLDISQRKVESIRYRITDHYRTKIADYFTLYGYKQNKVMYKPNNGLFKSRKYFNYIKTMDANIITKNDIDKEELEEIKEIFNSGVTWWHYFACNQDNVKMFESKKRDNVEVY